MWMAWGFFSIIYFCLILAVDVHFCFFGNFTCQYCKSYNFCWCFIFADYANNLDSQECFLIGKTKRNVVIHQIKSRENVLEFFANRKNKGMNIYGFTDRVNGVGGVDPPWPACGWRRGSA